MEMKDSKENAKLWQLDRDRQVSLTLTEKRAMMIIF